MSWKVLELYCGIGGAAAALGETAQVVAAVDVNRLALTVYGHNYRHPTWPRAIEGLSAADLARPGADLWWLSPPCQPFTRRGLQRDDADPRSRSLLSLLPKLEAVRPPLLALENVPGFARSRTREHLLDALARGGYDVRERELCPSELGWPNRRRRYYLLASRAGWSAPAERPKPRHGLADFLDEPPESGLALDPQIARRYRLAIDVVDPRDPAAVTSCFTAAYGHSWVRSGSYLREEGLRTDDLGTEPSLRRFSPAEVLRLLGFPASFQLPPELPRANAWRLAGNSLAVAAVREVLAELPR